MFAGAVTWQREEWADAAQRRKSYAEEWAEVTM